MIVDATHVVKCVFVLLLSVVSLVGSILETLWRSPVKVMFVTIAWIAFREII